MTRIPLGEISPNQGYTQNAYLTRFAWQHPHFHSYQQWQDARSQCTRHPDTRSWQFLYHGSRVYRFRLMVCVTPSTSLYCHSGQIQSAISAYIFSSRRQSDRIALRSNDYLAYSQSKTRLPATPTTNEISRYRKQQKTGIHDQQLRFTCIDHRRTLQISIASRVVLQMDKTASSYQTFLRHIRERSKNTIMDYHLCIRSSRNCEKKTQHRSFTLHNITDTKPDSLRKNTNRSIS